ncbi:MAG TPA: primosomal protein N' [Patescibacteria group bacterium]|nr:primosomal protein N' [Patescibacteria group bacterium]
MPAKSVRTPLPRIAEVIPFVRLPRTIDVFDYQIPPELSDSIQEGSIVSIPLRKQNVFGLISRLKETSSVPINKLRAVDRIVVDGFLPSEQMALLSWMSSYYRVSRTIILKMFLPATTRQFFESIKEDSKLSATAGKKSNPMSKHPWLRESTLIHYSDRKKTVAEYARIIQATLRTHGQLLILFPRVMPLQAFFAELPPKLQAKTIIYHASGRTSKGLQEAYTAIRSGNARVILGTRSALFAPFSRLQIIIVDDEESVDYKQEEPSPRYHAAEIIEQMKIIQPQLRIAYTSSLPSVERYNNTLDNRISFLPEPSFEQARVSVEILDIRHPEESGATYPFHQRLELAIAETLDASQSVFLLVNRRGEAAALVCRDCGWSATCPNCEVPLAVYNARTSTETLRCHQCGFAQAGVPFCSQCHGSELRYQGVGIQKVHAAAQKFFPKASIHDMSRESIAEKKSISPRIDKSSIVIGTPFSIDQFDFSTIGLMGVLAVDGALFSPHFRAAEHLGQMFCRMMSLSPSSRVMIQTVAPEHPLFALFRQSPKIFEDHEIRARRDLHYPPFQYIVKLIIQHQNRARAEDEALKWIESSTPFAQSHEISIEGPIRPLRPFVRGRHRAHLLLRAASEANLEFMFPLIPKDWIIDRNPLFLI